MPAPWNSDGSRDPPLIAEPTPEESMTETEASRKATSTDPLMTLQELAELRRDLPAVDVVDLVLEGREDLAARSQI